MVTPEENELLTRVGPGTPMGEVFRRYWIAAGVSREVPEPDSPPVRIRLLGEDLVMFRDTTGKVGLLAEKCAHRRASLFYGRNEECGLRCIYHGWKYDVEGNILDTPAEPAESMIKRHVKQTAYPTFEKNSLILTYMGPREKQPLVPTYEWLTLPADHVRVEGKFWNENNWLQGVEGDCDSAHVTYLHRNAVGGSFDLAAGMGDGLTFEVEEGPWLIKAASIRHTGPDQQYLRTNMFILPCIGGPPRASINGIADGCQAVQQVPADDYHTWRIDIYTQRSSPIDAPQATGAALISPAPRQEWPGLRGMTPVGPDWRKTANRGNDYLIDRQRQKTDVYSGIPFGAHTQDAAMTESMGAIADRWNEHLGESDLPIVAIRKLLLRVVRDVQEGKDPPGVAFRPEDNDFNLDLINATLPVDASWRDLAAVRTKLLYSGPPPRR